VCLGEQEQSKRPTNNSFITEHPTANELIGGLQKDLPLEKRRSLNNEFLARIDLC
jgi:hypothetical protein